jgi:hypothetical protein
MRMDIPEINLAQGWKEIQERTRKAFCLSTDPMDDWLRHNSSPEILKKIYGYLPEDVKIKVKVHGGRKEEEKLVL